MRVKFIAITPQEFFKEAQEKTGLSLQALAVKCGVHRRSFSDWKNGDCLTPLSVFQTLVRVSNVHPPQIKILPDYWHIKEAGRKGAIAQMRLYGNPGTPQGRSKGGSTTCRKLMSDRALAKQLGFMVTKKIRHPRRSIELAEYIGIILGDGGITNRQIVVSHHSETDKEHTNYLASLTRKLFGVSPTITFRKNKKVCEAVTSSKNMVDFLLACGMKVGNKVRQQVDIPDWIKKDIDLAIACLRGLIDTDGCFYVDSHLINSKRYYNPCLAFTNYSRPLLASVRDLFMHLGYHPTGKGRNLFLRRRSEIERYFREIGSHNMKHTAKFEMFDISFYKMHNNANK